MSLFSCCFTKRKALEEKVAVGGGQLRRVAVTAILKSVECTSECHAMEPLLDEVL